MIFLKNQLLLLCLFLTFAPLRARAVPLEQGWDAVVIQHLSGTLLPASALLVTLVQN
jgi:hypothetical protein